MIQNYELFRQSLIKIINNSGLDIGAIYFICKDVFKDVESAYISAVNKGLSEQMNKTTSQDSSEEPPTE